MENPTAFVRKNVVCAIVGWGLFGLSLYTKDLYLVITQNLIILHDEKHRFSVKSVALFMKSVVLFGEKRCTFHVVALFIPKTIYKEL